MADLWRRMISISVDRCGRNSSARPSTRDRLALRRFTERVGLVERETGRSSVRRTRGQGRFRGRIQREITRRDGYTGRSSLRVLVEERAGVQFEFDERVRWFDGGCGPWTWLFVVATRWWLGRGWQQQRRRLAGIQPQ